jgi:hypothetical protein
MNRKTVGSILGKSFIKIANLVEKIFLEINQSETRIVCDGHVYKRIGTK